MKNSRQGQKRQNKYRSADRSEHSYLSEDEA
jgi:hypothetical protein